MKNGGSVTTEYAYDTKGMRIIKEGPYGKSIYVDMGYVLSGASTSLSNPASRASAPAMVSNHVFMGNTRIASVVKHKEEAQAAMYFYASDHLGSSSVLTNQQGSYHERIEYLPYGETWVEDKANSSTYSTPYKFTSKEYDQETGWYYFGYRYYDPKIALWINTDPILKAYLPEKNVSERNLIAGGVFNPINLNLYIYSWNRPVVLKDYDGNFTSRWHEEFTQKGLEELGFNISAIKVINKGNVDVDKDAWNETTQYRHSMRGKIIINNKKIDETKEMAQEKQIDWIEKNLNDAVIDAIDGKYESALYKFGQALHTIQDEVSHDWLTIEEHGMGLNAYRIDVSPTKEKKELAINKTKDFGKIFIERLQTIMNNIGCTNQQIDKTIENLKKYK